MIFLKFLFQTESFLVYQIRDWNYILYIKDYLIVQVEKRFFVDFLIEIATKSVNFNYLIFFKLIDWLCLSVLSINLLFPIVRYLIDHKFCFQIAKHLPSILVPGFHLCIRQIQFGRQFHTVLYGKVFLAFETFFQSLVEMENKICKSVCWLRNDKFIVNNLPVVGDR